MTTYTSFPVLHSSFVVSFDAVSLESEVLNCCNTNHWHATHTLLNYWTVTGYVSLLVIFSDVKSELEGPLCLSTLSYAWYGRAEVLKFPFQHSCGIVTGLWRVLSWNFAECQVYVCLFKIQTCWGSVLYVYENFGQKISCDCCYLTMAHCTKYMCTGMHRMTMFRSTTDHIY